MKIVALATLLATAAPAWAQTPEPPQIQVTASGTVRTPPDMATVGFTLRGEGATSDDAAARLRDTARAVSAGIAGLMQNAKDFHSGNFAMTQVRARECDESRFGQQRLSTGACAIIGYIATMPVTIDTPRVADAGTLAGLVGRLGGMDAGIRRFWLRDGAPARARAMQAALANAQTEARLIAEGSGARLGQVLRVQDANYSDGVRELRVMSQSIPAAPPPPPPPPPVRIELEPEPIQTTVQLMVAYSIDR